MAKFKEGKWYEAGDAEVSPIRIIKRTAKTCLVENNEGIQWRMYIKPIEGSEIMTDSAVPKNWREAYTYDARFETKEAESWQRR